MLPDVIDVVLIGALQRDGRVSLQALATQVGLSRAAVRSRVRRLLESRVVRVAAIVHPSLAGTSAVAHLAIDVDGPVRPIADELAARPAVWSLTLTTGSHPIRMQLRTLDEAQLAEQVNSIRTLPCVSGVEAFRVHTAICDDHAVQHDLSETVLDAIDWRLIRELARDGRTSYTCLARTVGLSQSSIRVRVIRLLHGGVIHIKAIVDPRAAGSTELAGAGLTTTCDLAAAAARIAAVPGITYLAAGFGGYDLVCAFDALSRRGVVTALETIRAIPGVRVAESWQHLHVIKHTALSPDANL